MLMCLSSVYRRLPKTVFTGSHSFSMFARARPFLPLKNVRTYKKRMSKFIKGQTVADFKILDNIPDQFDLIYRSTMTKYLNILQVVAVGTVGLVILVFCTTTPDVENDRRPFKAWFPKSRSNENQRPITMAFLIAFALIGQFVVTKIPLRIYKHPKASKYTMILPTNIPMSTKRFNYCRGQVMPPDESPSILPWKRNTYSIHTETDNKSVIMFDQYFRRSADLSIMIGEQKDTDLDDDK